LIASLKGQSDAKVAKSRIAASTQNVSSKLAGVGVLVGRTKIRSFLEVLQSKPCLELKDKARGKAAKGGVVKRLAKEEARLATASASVRKTKASSVQGWVNRLVGLFQLGLGWVWVRLLQGLLNGPKDLTVDKRIRAVLASLKGFKGFGLSNGQARRKIRLGFLLKPSRRTRPTHRLKSSAVMLSTSSLASEDPLGASEVKPSEPVRFAGVGLSPMNTSALPSAVEVTCSGGPLSPEEDVDVGSSTVAQKKDEVGVWSLSEEADTSLTKTSASQDRLEAPEPSDDGLQVLQIGDVVNGYTQGAASKPKRVSVPESPLHTSGLELEGTVSGSEPTPLAVISVEESGFVPSDAGDGSSQLSAPGFSVPSAEELFGFLPAGSLSKDWEDFYSSLPTACVGLFDSKIIKEAFALPWEAFALPWEVDVPTSQSCREKEVSSSGAEINQVVRPSAPARSMLRRGFLGPRAVSPSPVVLKEVLLVIKGKEPASEDGSCAVSSFSVPMLPMVILPSTQEDKQGVQSTVAVVLPSAQGCPSSVGTDMTKPIPINSFGSSQWWYTGRVKEKLAKQLNKNKELIAEAVGVNHVVREDRVADALNLAPVLGLS
jgi:hypothetical protein